MRSYEEQHVATSTEAPAHSRVVVLSGSVRRHGRIRPCAGDRQRPGVDAAYLEQHGLDVLGTDATTAFVGMMRAVGHEARVLGVRSDDLGRPWHAALAQAMLLHLDRTQLSRALRRMHYAVVAGAVLAVDVEEGDNETWSDSRSGLPAISPTGANIHSATYSPEAGGYARPAVHQ